MIETASWGRRAGALVIDWLASNLVLMLFLGSDAWGGFGAMGVFVLESAILMALAGGSFGQLVTGLRVVRWDGVAKPVDLLRALARQVLIILVIPPLIFRPDGRGLHDLAMKTATVKMADLRR
ncbi:RDD family protein [Nocardioides yefusunii]|uniref:RDD family protein n=1 Tax=Nocardioides yefusunii TaxID=2500546 RepID=A0ABW1QSF9_9ACTN|nr:RDD family protein [Nocardioides yefusunii]